MNCIELKNLLPEVFALQTETEEAQKKSDIWRNEISFEKGKVYLLEAASGTGKSSLCSYIYGYRKDYQGQILFDGLDIKKMNTSQLVDLRKKSLSMLWQELRLFPELTALENVEIKNNLTGFQTKEQICRWFEQLGIDNRINTKIGKMSFGQQQRVALIRCLCQPFDFMFADEPVSHLDENNSSIMGEIMLSEMQRQGAGLIITSIGKHIDMHYDKVLTL